MKITDLRKDFGTFSLEIDRLELAPNRIHGLIGGNGCGKTTLLKLIAGTMVQDSGEIDLNGLTPRDITLIPRKPYLLHTSVYNNIIYPLKLRGIKPDKDITDFYLELSDLQELRKQYAPSLSSGEQQKLSFARAMIFSPKLILMDEALSNLDIESADSFERFILSRQSEKTVTWLIVSHRLSHIQRLCENIHFMHKGKVSVSGSVNLLRNPDDPFLKRYMLHESLKEGAEDETVKS